MKRKDVCKKNLTDTPCESNVNTVAEELALPENIVNYPTLKKLKLIKKSLYQKNDSVMNKNKQIKLIHHCFFVFATLKYNTD